MQAIKALPKEQREAAWQKIKSRALPVLKIAIVKAARRGRIVLPRQR